jgi:two-component system, OmpR family, response regulator
MSTAISLGNLTIDRDRFDVWVGERRLELTFVEFELLYQLARSPERVLTRQRLMQAVWREAATGHEQKLTVHMSRLRKKLRGTDPWRIETVTKRGYVLTASSQPAEEREEESAEVSRPPPRIGLAREAG